MQVSDNAPEAWRARHDKRTKRFDERIVWVYLGTDVDAAFGGLVKKEKKGKEGKNGS